ncbi:MAG TPA: hypothetical protein ENI68_08400 [Gammaproteobacteria bacterium]|nr:hypothetical protein [Gammaproteobacteria bacterium]
MRRLIIKVIVLFLLFSNLSWAAERGESLAVFQQNHDVSMHGASGNSGHVPSDECCHSGAHFVGIFFEAIIFLPVLNGSYKSVSVKHRYFISRQPPTPPPTV